MIDLSQETEALARRVADARQVSVDVAVRQALEASTVSMLLKPERPRDRSPEAVARRRASVDRIVREIAAMPILDPRSTQEIIDDLNAL